MRETLVLAIGVAAVLHLLRFTVRSIKTYDHDDCDAHIGYCTRSWGLELNAVRTGPL